MKVSLIYAPYFTNGDYPPLGASYIAAALRQNGGHEVLPHDFQWTAYRENLDYLDHFRRLEHLALAPREVSFILRPDLVLYSLYRKDYPGFKWAMPSNPAEKAGWGAFALMVENLAEKWAKIILEDNAPIAVFSTYLSNIFLSLPIAKAIKKLDPNIKIVFGGPGVGLAENAEFVLQTGFVDAAVIGEGELTAVELVNELEKQGKMPTEIPGVATLSNGSIEFKARPQIKDPDTLPIPDFDGFPHPGMSVKDYMDNRDNRYHSPFFEGTPVLSTRGCINRCAYCSETAFWKKFRQRSPENLINELEAKRKSTGSDVFLFCDSALNASREWLMEFSEAVKADGYKFLSYMIANETIDSTSAKAIADVGFKGVTLGIETFSQRLLSLVRKKASREMIDRTIGSLIDNGIHVKINVLCGFPTETEADVMDSIEAIEEWSSRSEDSKLIFWDAGHPVRVEPYSDFFANPSKYEIKIKKHDIPLPEGLEGLKKILDKISLTWDPGFSIEETMKRCKKIRKAASASGQ